MTEEAKPHQTVCRACDRELKPVFAGETKEFQFDDALLIDFRGAYGMFVDPIDQPDGFYRVIICSACARELCRAFPWISALLQSEAELEQLDDQALEGRFVGPPRPELFMAPPKRRRQPPQVTA
jgi:hypothetical protein